MKLIIDDAHIDLIKKIYEYYPVDGVTTNPSILAKSGRQPFEVLKEIRSFIGEEAELHVQVVAKDADGMVDKFRYCIDTLMGNRAMMVAIVAFAATVLVVWFIRRLSIDHAWTIAMITGALLNILILLFGDLMYSTDISIIGLILGSIVSVLLVKVLQFFVFNVDYSRTEMVQFEDDEYYYYVKAVPKNTVATPEKRVKTIRVPEKAVNRSKRDTGRQ